MPHTTIYRDLLVVNYYPGRHVVGLGASISELGRGLQTVLEALLRVGVKPISIEVMPNQSREGESLLWMVIDVGDVEEGALKSAILDLESSKTLSSVQLLSPVVPGLMTDAFFNYKGFLGNRAVIIGTPALDGFLRGLYESFGEAGAVFLYHVGKSIGARASKFYREALNIRDLRQLYRAAELFFQALGYVRSLNLTKLEKGVITATLTDNLECLLLKDVRLPPTSHWVRGMIEGVVEVIEGERYESEEVDCINKGSPVCRIVLRPVLS
ncbi:MAG: hypothetical protein QW668_05075 [Nitrososphaerota archaeon]